MRDIFIHGFSQYYSIATKAFYDEMSIDANEFSLKVVEKHYPCVTSTVTVDVPEFKTRYSVHLAYFRQSNTYVLTVLNFGNITVSMHNKYFNPDFKHMLQQKGLGTLDIIAIQRIVDDILIKDIRNKF